MERSCRVSTHGIGRTENILCSLVTTERIEWLTIFFHQRCSYVTHATNFEQKHYTIVTKSEVIMRHSKGFFYEAVFHAE